MSRDIYTARLLLPSFVSHKIAKNIKIGFMVKESKKDESILLTVVFKDFLANADTVLHF